MTPQHILFLAEGQLGDLLLLTPALRAVKESFPSVHLCVLVLDRRTPLRDVPNPTMFDVPKEACPLATNPHVDELILVSRQFLRNAKGIKRLLCEASLVKLIRAKKFDTVICTFPEDRFALWAFGSDAKVRVGQRRQSMPWLLTHGLNIEKQERGVLEYYCDLVRAIGATVQSKTTEYLVADEAKEWAKRALQDQGILGKRIVGVHPGASGDYKIWTPSQYGELIARLSTRATVVLLGGQFDEPIVSAIRNSLHSDVAYIQADWNGKLAALMQHCALCITNDSGPRHLSIALGVPSLALFRKHCEKEWGAYEENERVVTVRGSDACRVCPPGICLDKIPEGERFASHCMRMIRVEDVVARLFEMIGR